MGDIERSWLTHPSRRAALARVAGFMAASPLASAVAQIDPRPLGLNHRALGLAEMQTAFDFEPIFFANVPQTVYDYTAHGDGSEWNLRRNRQAFGIDLLPGLVILQLADCHDPVTAHGHVALDWITAAAVINHAVLNQQVDLFRRQGRGGNEGRDQDQLCEDGARETHDDSLLQARREPRP